MNAKEFVKQHADLVDKIKSLHELYEKAMAQVPSVVTEDNFREHDRLSRIAEEIEWEEATAWEQLHQEIEAAVSTIPYRKAREATRAAIIRDAGLDG